MGFPYGCFEGDDDPDPRYGQFKSGSIQSSDGEDTPDLTYGSQDVMRIATKDEDKPYVDILSELQTAKDAVMAKDVRIARLEGLCSQQERQLNAIRKILG